MHKEMQQLIHMLKVDEGIAYKPYFCTAGALTIGIGHNLDARGVSDSVIDLMLSEDIAYNCAMLNKRFDWFAKLNPARQCAILSMSYMGINSLSKFKRMIAAIIDKDFDTAAMEVLDSKYARDVGDRANRIANIIRSGTYEGYGHLKPQIIG